MPLTLINEGDLAAYVVGTLGDYIVTMNDAQTLLELRKAEQFDAVSDTINMRVVYLSEFDSELMGIGTNDGQYLYVGQWTASGPYRMKRISRNGYEFDTVVDMYDIPRVNYFRTMISGDGTQWLYFKFGSDTNMYGIDLATGAAAWTWDVGGSIGGGFVLGFPVADRILIQGGGPDRIILFDPTTATEIDSLSTTFMVDGPVGGPGPGPTCLVLDYDSGVSPMPASYNIVDYDATTDTISWRYPTWPTFEMNWTDGSYPQRDSRGYLSALAPQAFLTGTPISAYVIDYENRIVHESDPNGDYGEGVYGTFMAAPVAVFCNINYTGSTSTAFIVEDDYVPPSGSGPYLRQKQSPATTPRVSARLDV